MDTFYFLQHFRKTNTNDFLLLNTINANFGYIFKVWLQKGLKSVLLKLKKTSYFVVFFNGFQCNFSCNRHFVFLKDSGEHNLYSLQSI